MTLATGSRSSRRTSTSGARPSPLPTYRTRRRPERYSDGPLYGELLAALGRRPRRGQQLALDVGLERLDGPGSPFAYDTVDIVAGRRYGKTVISLGVALCRMLDGDITLPNGRVVPFLGAHTAQNLTRARARFLGDLVEPLRAFLSEDEWNPRVHEVLSASQTSLGIDLDPHDDGRDPSGRHLHSQRVTVVPPTYDGVRGEGLAHIGFDEVLTFTAREGEQLMSGARPTLKDFQGHAQVWRVSNVGTFSDSKTWLRQIRDRGRDATAADPGTGVAYFEWTIPDDVDPLDEEIWWGYYPPLADGLARPEDLHGDLREMSTDAFAAEYLGRWPDAVATLQWLAIDRALWEGAGTTDELAADAPAAIGVDLDPYQRSSSITAAAMRPGSDTALVEVVDHRPGSGWVEDAVVEWAPRVAAIGIDDYGPGHDLLERLAKIPDVADKLVALKGNDLMAACYNVDAALRERRLQWRASDFHAQLTAAVAAAQRTTGRGWQWERRVATSQTPWVAATLAVWALGRAPEPQSFFVY